MQCEGLRGGPHKAACFFRAGALEDYSPLFVGGAPRRHQYVCYACVYHLSTRPRQRRREDAPFRRRHSFPSVGKGLGRDYK